MLVWCIPLSLFLLPNAVLNMAGIDYMGSQGSAFGKLHPVFYLCAVGIGLTLLPGIRHKRSAAEWIAGSFRPLLLAGSLAALAALILARTGGGDVSAALVTFVMPALLAYLLQYASEGDRRVFSAFITAFFVINSLVGLLEMASAWRLLPYYIGDRVVTFDPRPTALLGHPLSNALLTGVILLSLVTRQIASGITTGQFLQLALHMTALFAFGGRAALLLAIVVAAIYMARYSGLFVPVKVGQSMRAFLLASMGLVVLAAVVALGVAETMADRLLYATDSTGTRFAALRLPGILSAQEWLIGAEPAARILHRSTLNTPYGIELSPIAMIHAYGLPIAALLIAATWQLLFRWARTSFPGADYVVFFFILATLTSLSIGSKSLLISQMLVILFALRPIGNEAASTQEDWHNRLYQPGDFRPPGGIFYGFWSAYRIRR